MGSFFCCGFLRGILEKVSIAASRGKYLSVLARKRGIPASHPGKKKRLNSKVQVENATISH